MSIDLSPLTLAASIIYVTVVIGCLFAAGSATKQTRPYWQRRAWLFLTALFLTLLVSRIFGLEEFARDVLRQNLRAGGNYAARRDVQGIIAGIVIMLSAGASALALVKAKGRIRGRSDTAAALALAAGTAMMFLVAVRLISLHALDWFLYGPLKLNWIGDIGLSATVLAASVYFVKLVRART